MNCPEKELQILKFWDKNKIFEKTLKKTKKGPRFVFYEGPPFANGKPGIHHLLARAFKDIMARYKTMQGFFVERKAGWDTHGLPTEMEAEKRLKIKNKKDIEKIGIEKFIETCRDSVFIYKKEWEDFTRRMGFWINLDDPYITCTNEYIESLWWILKQIWEKGLLYEDYKVVHYCPRCGTSLSSHEVAQGYKTVAEDSIYVKFPLKEKKDTYFLAWTTTPWTLPGNVALAVGPDVKYVKVSTPRNGTLILAKERLAVLENEYEIKQELIGSELAGLEYEPLFKFTKLDKKAHFLVLGDFISTEDGTGIVHIAPAFGEDDMKVGKENNLPLVLNVDETGKFKKEVKPYAGKFVKEADPDIIHDLDKRSLLFKKELYEHEYPFCWRCDTPLLYYAKNAWFIKTTAVKDKLIENNEKINWIPHYLKHGRFGEWLREVKDWNLSRERYWGTPLPIWKCRKCKEIKVVGSIKELGKKINDLHKPQIDILTFKCKCGGEMHRVTEVIDCWFDSGSMPFAQWHYPFENKERIDKGTSFPADYISEGIDQTRGWFYTLLAVSTLLGKENPYKNLVVVGIVLDAKGNKMSKSKGNVVVPEEVMEKYGADVARYYFYTINQPAEPKRFDFKDLQDKQRRFFDTLWHSYVFFSTYIDIDKSKVKIQKSNNILDRWIISRLHSLNEQVVNNLDKYDIVSSARLFEDFVDDLSNWYIRRSRRRFQKPLTKKEKDQASQTLYYVLLNFSKLIAPFTPFIAEAIYQELKNYTNGNEQSVHLCDYPKANKKLIDEKLEEIMQAARDRVAQALAERAKLGRKIRQPLAVLDTCSIVSMDTAPVSYRAKVEPAIVDLIKEEVNVKRVKFGKIFKLDTKLTAQLKEEGMMRELVRQIQDMRRQAGMTHHDSIEIFFSNTSKSISKLIKNWQKYIKQENLAKSVEEKKSEGDMEREVKLDDEKVRVVIKKK